MRSVVTLKRDSRKKKKQQGLDYKSDQLEGGGVPGRTGKQQKAIGGKPRALIQLERLEHVAPLLYQEGDVGVRHDHPAEVEGLEAVESLGDLADPGGGVPAPVLAYEVEHGCSGLALELERL